jgi:hypothetical protein
MAGRAGGVCIEFRALTDADLPLLHRWLNEPGVVQWWEGEDVTWEAVVRSSVSPGTGVGASEPR